MIGQTAHADASNVVRLQVLTLGWMTVEASASIVAAIGASSLALAAFGGDSLIELASAAVVLVRFSDHRQMSERIAARIAGVLLLVLAALVVAGSIASFFGIREPQPSRLGIAVLVCAAVIMPWLAREKRRLAAEHQSGALRADAVESALCGYLALIALGGVAINSIWTAPLADTVAALAIVPFIVREAWVAVRQAEVCCSH